MPITDAWPRSSQCDRKPGSSKAKESQANGGRNGGKAQSSRAGQPRQVRCQRAAKPVGQPTRMASVAPVPSRAMHCNTPRRNGNQDPHAGRSAVMAHGNSHPPTRRSPDHGPWCAPAQCREQPAVPRPASRQACRRPGWRPEPAMPATPKPAGSAIVTFEVGFVSREQLRLSRQRATTLDWRPFRDRTDRATPAS